MISMTEALKNNCCLQSHHIHQSTYIVSR